MADTKKAIDREYYLKNLKSYHEKVAQHNFVAKETGKGLSTVDFTDTNYVHTDNNYSSEEKQKVSNNADAIATLNGSVDVVGSVDKKIADAIGATQHLTKKVIDHKPTVAEAKEDVLYLVPSGKDGIYDQYALLDGKIASFGSTEVDLSGYVKSQNTEEVTISSTDTVIIHSDDSVMLDTLNAYLDGYRILTEKDAVSRVNSLTDDKFDSGITANGGSLGGNINISASGTAGDAEIDVKGYNSTTNGSVINLKAKQVQVNGLPIANVWTGTQAQYNALGTKSETTLYMIEG